MKQQRSERADDTRQTDIDKKDGLTSRERREIRKTQSRDRIREIRHILMGSYFTQEDGRLASGGGRWMSPLGMGDGAGTTMIFGVKNKRYRYNSGKKNNRQAVYAARQAMMDIGRQVALDTAEDAACCYIKGRVFRPVVLVFEEISLAGGTAHLELRAYCGRSPLAFLALRSAVSKFDKVMPDNIRRI